MELLLALVIKHFIVDIGVQSMIPATPKHEYFRGHQHYIQHGVGAVVVSVLLVDPLVALAIGLADYVVHWHIDFAKHHLNRWINAKVREPKWWWTMVLDQICHMMFYYSVAKYVSGM